jgi:alkylhydroperoxidase family enzyme
LDVSRTPRPADDLGDLVERHREHVVEHERDPLGGVERVELAALVVQIAIVNVWNRLNVATRQVAGTGW